MKSLRSAIASQQRQAKESKSEMLRLTKKERKLFRHLAGLEDKVGQLEHEVWQKETELAEIEKRQKRILHEYDQLSVKRDHTAAELDKLMSRLWPLHHANIGNKLSGISGWPEADRRFTWLASIYKSVEAKSAQLTEQTRQLAANLAEQDSLKLEAEKALADIGERKKTLLDNKLELVHSIQKVRAELVSQEEELTQILDAIRSMSFRLKALTENRFSAYKGMLPWPAEGTVVARYKPKARPPQRGVGLKLIDDAPVRSVSWGKVVHNDVLRGFGKVVILYHGEHYYSLYAFLSESMVRTGQEVEKDEIIGHAGYYPKARGSGLYFELRHHKQAVNPFNWLEAQNG